MKVAFDTNILLGAMQPQHPKHGAADGCILRLRNDGHKPALTAQSIYEYWVV